MNGSKAVIESYLQQIHASSLIDQAIALPFPYLFLSSPIRLAGQNVHWMNSGAWTGEVSALMLKDLQIKWTIIGHSERRKNFGETDEIIGKKVRQCICNAGIGVILCVGELTKSFNEKEALEIVTCQLKVAIEGLDDYSSLTVAYEPIWAIGTGEVPTAKQISCILQQIRQIICKEAKTGCESVRLLYGGSVNEENAQEIASLPEVDGVLVGGASMNALAFNTIVAAFEHANFLR